MSSATSIERDGRISENADVLPQADIVRSHGRPSPTHDSGLHAWHFFVLAALVAATGGILVSRQPSPERLVLLTLTIAAAGAAAAAFHKMLAPFAVKARTMTSDRLSERSRSVLQREKMLVLRSIKELEFDRAMGKVSAEDFEDMAARLRARAVTLMKQLDEDGSGYRATIERELKGRLETARPVATSNQCQCGTVNDSDAVFCKRCGMKLAPGSTAQ